MRTFFILMLGVVFSFGCARVRVEAPKEPIKVDISMRLDVYQHIQKDIDAIEGIVSGSKKEVQPSDNQSLLDYFISNAYAQEGLSPEAEQAALRRRDRSSVLATWQARGVVGEDKLGLLQIRDTNISDPSLAELVKMENSDRMIIYRSLAQKNKTTVEEIQKLYAQRLQRDVPSGTPIEISSATTGRYEWIIK